MRRVGGYNLDIFHPQSERPYTARRLASTSRTCWSAPKARSRSRAGSRWSSRRCRARACWASSTSRPSTARWSAAQHIVKLGPTAVELVDRTMIELARANPAFRPIIDGALIGEPEAILLVEFARRGGSRDRCSQSCDELHALMGDLGLPGSVVDLADAGAQKALWDVRKAGLNIMMSMRGDGKPVSFIEDCAVPLEHLADYTAALTEVFAQARHERHLVRARLGRHAARAPDPRHAPRGPTAAPQDARHRRGSGRARAPLQGRVLAASTATAWCAASGSRGSSVRGSRAPSRRSRTLFDPDGPAEPRQDRAADADGRRALFRFTPRLRGAAARRRRSTGRRGTCTTIPPPRR